jgi:hypothetical protein
MKHDVLTPIIASAFCIACLAFTLGCSDQTATLLESPLRNMLHNSPPPWDYSGPFNVFPAEVHGESTWVTHPDLPAFTETEFVQAREIVCAVARELGFADDEWVQNKNLFVWDDNYFDRTIRVEYSHATGTHERFLDLIRTLQRRLNRMPQWRILLCATSDDAAIWVYPTCIRTCFDTDPSTEEERVLRAGKRAT